MRRGAVDEHLPATLCEPGLRQPQPADTRLRSLRIGQRWRWLGQVSPRTIECVLCGAVLAVFLTMAVAPFLFTAADPIAAFPRDRLLAPGVRHLFGTDQIGRDLFTRTVYGTDISLRSGALAVAIAAISGSLLGLVAGYAGGLVDNVVGRVVDAMMATPGFLLALAVLSAIGSGAIPAAVAVGVASIPVFARVMRAETLRVKASVFVEAARVSGVRPMTILRRHVLPNAWGSVLSLAVLEFGQALLIISALSYLGFGEAPPTPEWGALIAAGQPQIATAWWLSVLPGLVLASLVLVINRSAHLLRKSA